MDFIEDLKKYDDAMNNAYNLITGRTSFEDTQEDILPFNPEVGDGKDAATLDMIIEHFSNREEYEKCAELMTLKSSLETI